MTPTALTTTDRALTTLGPESANQLKAAQLKPALELEVDPQDQTSKRPCSLEL